MKPKTERTVRRMKRWRAGVVAVGLAALLTGGSFAQTLPLSALEKQALAHMEKGEYLEAGLAWKKAFREWDMRHEEKTRSAATAGVTSGPRSAVKAALEEYRRGSTRGMFAKSACENLWLVDSLPDTAETAQERYLALVMAGALIDTVRRQYGMPEISDLWERLRVRWEDLRRRYPDLPELPEGQIRPASKERIKEAFYDAEHGKGAYAEMRAEERRAQSRQIRWQKEKEEPKPLREYVRQNKERLSKEEKVIGNPQAAHARQKFASLEFYERPGKLRNHIEFAWPIHVIIPKNGKYFAVTRTIPGEDGRIEEILNIQPDPNGVPVFLRVYDMEGHELWNNPAVENIHALSEDGTRAVVWMGKHWEGEELLIYSAHSNEPKRLSLPFVDENHIYFHKPVALSPEGRYAATQDAHTLSLIDTETAQIVWQRPVNKAYGRPLFSPDGSWIVTTIGEPANPNIPGGVFGIYTIQNEIVIEKETTIPGDYGFNENGDFTVGGIVVFRRKR